MLKRCPLLDKPLPSAERLNRPSKQQIQRAGHQGRAGDRQNPGPHDVGRHAPADRTEALERTDTEDGSRDGMSCTDWDAAKDDHGERYGRTAFSTKPVYRPQLDDALPHRLDDPPTADQRSQSHGDVTGQHDLRRDWSAG